jgi:hypothetical protein
MQHGEDNTMPRLVHAERPADSEARILEMAQALNPTFPGCPTTAPHRGTCLIILPAEDLTWAEPAEPHQLSGAALD